MEALENRRMLATITVNSSDGSARDGDPSDSVCDTGNADSGFTGICTLRAAAAHANSSPGTDNIRFNIPGGGVPVVNLPTQVIFASPVILDATTQPGAGTVELRSSASGSANVISLLLGSSGSTVRGFVINSSAGGVSVVTDNNTIVGNRFGTDANGAEMPITNTAIAIAGKNNIVGGTTEEDRNIISNSVIGVAAITPAANNTIRGNYIGTNADGTARAANPSSGILVNFASGTTIEENVIAASGVGIQVLGSTASGTIIRDNFVGTDKTGAITDPDSIPVSGDELGNGKGIFVNDAPSVLIEDNVIAGSTGVGTDFGHGIHLANSGASNAIIIANKIGVDLTGRNALGNSADGILIEAVSNVTVGGSLPDQRNIISANGGDGVTVFGTSNSNASGNQIRGNYIGVDVTGKVDLGNTFRGVHIDQLSSGNIVGGDFANDRNIISGNDSDGVIIALSTSTDNVVKGNYIGTEKDGLSPLGNSGSGIFIFNAPDNLIGESDGSSLIGNVIAANQKDGVKIQGEEATGNIVVGNRIGTDKDGTLDLPNLQDGVSIIEASTNEIGAVFAQGPDSPGFPGNVIAAIRSGIRIEGAEATRNQILSNLIGVDITGKKAWATIADVGIHVIDGSRNWIGVPSGGGAVAGANTISNNVVGVHLEAAQTASGTGTLGSFVAGNYIGTDLEGEIGVLPNDIGNISDGILISGSSNNYIGGQPSGSPELPGNIIAGNGGDGVRIENDGTGNVIQRNQIYSNELLGIDLGGDGVTSNDKLDEDSGDNELQNSPFVTSVIRSNARRQIVGDLHAKPLSAYRVEIFVSEELDASGFGEGQTFVGAIDDVKTNAEGNATFTYDPPTPLASGFLTATATDTSGNTSEFSCGTPVMYVPTDGHVFGVTNTNDDGGGSLRNAIINANGTPGRDVIQFCLGGTQVETISLKSALPEITDPVIIDGLSHADAECNTNTLEDGSNANLKIEIDGSTARMDVDGLRITGGNSIIRGLVINGFSGSAIHLADEGGNNIYCNYLGTNVAGTEAVANLHSGISIVDSAENIIGGAFPEELNLISGNSESGVNIHGSRSQNNVVDGNLIGTNAPGTATIANKTGISIRDASGNVLGGHGNVISGSFEEGVLIFESAESGAATNNLLVGNRIGTNASGIAALPNARGVRIMFAAGNHVGGIPSGAISSVGNLISGNAQQGVMIEGLGAEDNRVRGNYIGTDESGTSAVPNGAEGVLLGVNSKLTVVGGLSQADRNLISGNKGDGVSAKGSPGSPSTINLIYGNYIGTDVTGTQRLGNEESGVAISNATFISVGGSSEGAGNLISANKYGVKIDGADATNNSVEANLIGTDLDGFIGDDPENAPLHNLMHGVYISGASDNRIGTELDPQNLCTPGISEPANTIAGNRHNGIRVDGLQAESNSIACNAISNNGHELGIKGHGIVIEKGSKNSIRRNSIFENAGRGIDLNDDSITLNDLKDDDMGANGLQDYPVVIDVEFGVGPALLGNLSTWVLNSKPNTTYQIDFFSNDAPDPSGFGEGQYPIHTEEVTTDVRGNGTVTLTSTILDSFLSATATDPNGNTSEFSMIDTDGDALADAWETQGTDANEDGLVDDWEKGHFDLNEDGTNDHVTNVFLPGANPFHKDLFVEVDTMVESNTGPGLSQPTQAVLNVVRDGQAGKNDGFANVPNDLVNNPDGEKGITLHAILSDIDVPHKTFNNADWPSFDAIKQTKFGNPAKGATPSERAGANSANVLAAKRLAYRYALFADRRMQNTISGVAELPEEWEIPYFGGNDMIVTLGGWGTHGGTRGGTAVQQQGTFMHELGHILGLRHGGTDHVTFKPNYFSSMNYMWQTPKNYLPNWVLDYSRVDFGPLNENSLNESLGVITTPDPGDQAKALAIAAMRSVQIGGSSTRRAIFRQALNIAVERAAAGKLILPMNGAVDFSRLKLGPFAGAPNAGNVTTLSQNASTPHDDDMSPATAANADTGLSIDINGDGQRTLLEGQEDWSKIRFYFLESAQGNADGIHDDHDHDEDFYIAEDEITMDYGDAPSGYPTLRTEDGARHQVPGPNNPILGSRVDLEADGQPDASASADDTLDGFDLSGDLTPQDPNDEDGVVFTSNFVPGQLSTVTVTVHLPSDAIQSAKLDGWIDFNADGDWNDLGEKVFDSTLVSDGENVFQIQVPSDAELGTTFSRFRLSTEGTAEPTGAAADGEVEDYAVDIVQPESDIELLSFTSDANANPATLTLTYEIHNTDSSPFEFAFFASTTPRYDSMAMKIGSEVTVSDPALLTTGIHSVAVSQQLLHATLVDSSVPFVLAIADANNGVAETNEENNSAGFLGIFHQTASTVVVRGRDTDHDESQDVVTIVESGDDLAISFNGTQRQHATADVSSIVILTYGGNDEISYQTGIPFVIHAGSGHDALTITNSGQTLDLRTLPRDSFSGVESIDITGSGANRLSLSPASVSGLSDTNTVRIRHNEDDTVDYSTGWSVALPEFVSGKSVHVISDGSTRLEIDNTRHWMNPLQNLDANLDEVVAPNDALVIINTINFAGSRELRTPTNVSELPALLYDTNGDKFVSPIDVLLVVNFLNRGSGEAESTFDSLSESLTLNSQRESARDLAYAGLAYPVIGPKSGSRIGIAASTANVDAIFDYLGKNDVARNSKALTLGQYCSFHSTLRKSKSPDSETTGHEDLLSTDLLYEELADELERRIQVRAN